MPQKNFLQQTLTGTALVIALLLLLSLIPEFEIGSFHFKRINILSDILYKEITKTTPADTIEIIKPVYMDTCKTGLTCIEDYTTDTSGLKIFLSALDSTKKRSVRIAFFADSYVEGDIMLDPLRDTLQAIFGGSGVGYVPITSEVAGFRQTVIHSFINWKTYSITGERNPEHPLGFAGYSFVPKDENRVLFRAITRKRLSEFSNTEIFYGNTEGGNLTANGELLPLQNSKRLQSIITHKQQQTLELSVSGNVKTDLYGVSFENENGISVDNFSMRGNSGIGLSYVSEEMYRDLDSLHHYDLVVLSYGLNVANEKAKNYDWYVHSMNPTIAMIKRAFPHSSILLIGCSDRAAKVNGEYQTMPMLKELISVQRKMAATNGVCFWNLFEAMGGDSTMVNWANLPKHPLANKDYTHLTFYGGKKVAEIFLETLLYEKEKYERKKMTK